MCSLSSIGSCHNIEFHTSPSFVARFVALEIMHRLFDLARPVLCVLFVCGIMHWSMSIHCLLFQLLQRLFFTYLVLPFCGTIVFMNRFPAMCQVHWKQIITRIYYMCLGRILIGILQAINPLISVAVLVGVFMDVVDLYLQL